MSERIPFHATPMLATVADRPFHRPGWVYEEKYDGYRILAYKEGARVTLRSRNARDRTASFAAIADDLQKKQRERGDADYLFDIPVELARVLTGFRHDAGDYPVDRFEVLERVQAGKKWWEFWKGPGE